MDAGDESFQQLGKLLSVTSIASIVGEILGDEIQLARSLQLEELCLAHDLVEREGTVPATHQWNRAEGAAVVAAFADLHVPHVRQIAGVHPDARM